MVNLFTILRLFVFLLCLNYFLLEQHPSVRVLFNYYGFHLRYLTQRSLPFLLRHDKDCDANCIYCGQSCALNEAEKCRLNVSGSGDDNVENNVCNDHTRLILKFEKSDDTARSGGNKEVNDYINANYISTQNEGKSVKKYIATQGPLSSTVTDFWHMVWQENSRVIVMVTNLVEKGREKCFPYWPQVGSVMQTGNYIIKNMAEFNISENVFYELYLHRAKKFDEGRLVYHFHCKSWPDRGIPKNLDTLIEFVQVAHGKIKFLSFSGPMIVHCSAGIGRAGTFIVIDNLINQIRNEGLETEIDICETVYNVRQQRSGLVQNQSQYMFIYYVIDRYVSNCLALSQSQSKGCSDQSYMNIDKSVLQSMPQTKFHGKKI